MRSKPTEDSSEVNAIIQSRLSRRLSFGGRERGSVREGGDGEKDGCGREKAGERESLGLHLDRECFANS